MVPRIGMDGRTVCRNFASTGSCKFGANCRFAHGPQGQGYVNYNQGGSSNPPGSFGSRGGHGSMGRGGHGQQFSSNRPNSYQANQFQPRQPKVGAPKQKLCFFYHRDVCTHANCRDLHQFTYQGDLTKTSRYDLTGPGTAVLMLTPSQVAAASGNEITVFDYATQTVLANLQTQCRDLMLGLYSPPGGQFLVFAGNT